jgi:hypothetical protein
MYRNQLYRLLNDQDYVYLGMAHLIRTSLTSRALPQLPAHVCMQSILFVHQSINHSSVPRAHARNQFLISGFQKYKILYTEEGSPQLAGGGRGMERPSTAAHVRPCQGAARGLSSCNERRTSTSSRTSSSWHRFARSPPDSLV